MDITAERAERERARYNAGLQRDQYDKVMNASKVWFIDQRRKRAAEVFQSFSNPKVLEIGSATWRNWIETNGVQLEQLTCINISESELEHGREQARSARNKPNFHMMDAHDLKFDDQQFDIVFGSAILHHLDMSRALAEIERVLAPGGVIMFAEPLDINPVGRIVRAMTPEARTEDETPFRGEHLALLERHFACTFTYEGFVSVPVGVATSLLKLPARTPISKAAYGLDRALGQVPGLRRMFRHVFIEGRKRTPTGATR